ncbi:hypothetical protein D3C85_1834140 [compost metagenome]
MQATADGAALVEALGSRIAFGPVAVAQGIDTDVLAGAGGVDEAPFADVQADVTDPALAIAIEKYCVSAF